MNYTSKKLIGILEHITGYALSLWVPAAGEEAAKKATLQWLGLIGDLFIRLLTCFV